MLFFMKKCADCDIEKPESDFYANKWMKSGLQSYCKDCTKARARKSAKANPAKTKANVKKGWAKHQYGLSTAEYERLMSSTDVCSICGVQAELQIDHDHTTGDVRGLLCNRCNVWIARLNEDIKWLASAMEYLETPPFGAGSH